MSSCLSLEMLEVKILSIWSGLIMVASIVVWFFTNSFVMFGFFAASLATSVIGMISVFSIVIMMSPNHSTSSTDSPQEIRKFQENIRVSTHLYLQNFYKKTYKIQIHCFYFVGDGIDITNCQK